MNAPHDRGEARFGFLEGPTVARGVLLHFQRGGGNAARIGCLCETEQYVRILEQANCFRNAGPVRALPDCDDAVADQRRGVISIEFVLVAELSATSQGTSHTTPCSTK